jgi:hypothetical protein
LGAKKDPLKMTIAGYQDRVGKHVDYTLLMSIRSIEQEFTHTSNLYSSSTRAAGLSNSPRDLARLYRRLDYKASPGFRVIQGRYNDIGATSKELDGGTESLKWAAAHA